MISLRNVTKTYAVRGTLNVVLNDVSFDLPRGQSLGIVGKNGAGKSTLLRILAGIEMPDDGRIVRQGRVSWPIGFGGGFNGSL